MPQFPSRGAAGGIYKLNAAAEAAAGENWPLPPPLVVPSNVSATQVLDEMRVSFTPPTLTGSSFNNPAPATNDYFGSVVSVSGNYVAVGVPDDDTNASQAGTVYLYYVANGSYTLRQTIAPTSANGRFGAAIEVNGGTMVVGAPGLNTVYVYTLTGPAAQPWALAATISGPSGTSFGTAVSTDGTWVAAATSATHASREIRVYERGNDAATWTQVGGMTTTWDGANFGYGVNIRNGHLMYTRSEGGWHIGQMFYNPDFNYMVRANPIRTIGLNATPFVGAIGRVGNTVAIGVNNTSTGNCVGVYQFITAAPGPDWQWWQGDYWVTETKSPGGYWAETQVFAPPVANTNFGCALAMTETELAIGADGVDVGATNAGAVYFYSKLDGPVVTPSFSLLHTLQANTVQAQGLFGGALAFVEAGKPYHYLWIGERQRQVSGINNAGAVWTFNPQVHFLVQSNPGNVTATRKSSPISLALSSFNLGTTYTFSAAAWTPEGGAGGAAVTATPTTAEFRGSAEFTAAGTYTWICPAGVTTVSAVVVGSGGTGGGRGPGAGGAALAYRTNISVTPGQSYTIVVGASNANPNYSGISVNGSNSSAFGIVAGGGKGTAGNYAGGTPSGTFTGGGNGGNAAIYVEGYWYYNEYDEYVYQDPYWMASSGGGGAGGYAGNGGNAGGDNASLVRTDGAGGGGAGGTPGMPGGGVGLYGQGANGVGNGKGGSGGNDGGSWGTVGTLRFGSGGAGNPNSDDANRNGGRGAVRIIWGTVLGAQRNFPTTGTGNV